MIVDTHAHLGWDHVFDVEFTAQELVDSQEINRIDMTLVQPSLTHRLDTVKTYHDQIASLAKQYPGKFYGMANPDPHLKTSDYQKEVRRCVRELGFVGVKLHPFAHAVNPTGRHGQMVFETSFELRVPVMVHTGPGIPWAAPSLLGPTAKKYPKNSIVVAHAGMMILAGEAIQLATEHANVALECSWTGGFLIREWVKKLGPQKILFGSDHADNAPTELAKFRSLGLSDQELAWVLGLSAMEIYKLKGPRA